MDRAHPPADPVRLTLDYYEQHAEPFARRTMGIDLSPLYEEFLPLVPSGGCILDAGCGTGRDSAAFLERGFRIRAFDGAAAMVELATRRIGQPVLHLAFDQIAFDHEFDAVWACASLLHVPKDAMPDTFRRLHDALVSNGVLFASFKRGTGEQTRDGRFFSDYDEASLAEFAAAQPGWEVIKLWGTDDIGQWRAGVTWVNLLARAR